MDRLISKTAGNSRTPRLPAPQSRGKKGTLHGIESLWSPLHAFALDQNDINATQPTAASSRQQTSLPFPTLTGSSCNKTETAWGGPWCSFAPPRPNEPSQPTPACPGRRSQPAAGLGGRIGPAREMCRNEGVLPVDCREGNNPAPAARTTVPSPSTCATACLSLRLEGRQGAMGETIFVRIAPKKKKR